MAVRLTVVISQVQGGNRQQQEREANLIAALIGCPGIDVSLIGGLAEVAQPATDRLVLEGLSGDFALVAWQPPADVIDALGGLEVAGYRAPHAGDPGVAKQPGRRIYCFDPGSYADAETLVAALGDLLRTRQVKTVALGPPGSPLSRAASDGVPAAARADAADQPAGRSSSEAAEQAAGGGPPAGRDTAPPVAASARSAREPADGDGEREQRAREARLDALVDDLNSLDL